MKNIIKTLVFITIIFFITGCSSNKKEKISKIIELDINNCKIEKEVDTHGGFLGDGEYFAKIKCSKENKISKNWKELPLSQELVTVTEMKFCDGTGCKNIYEKYSIPDIENGYYYFYDRHSSSKNKYDSKDINDRSSWNFSLAIIDIDKNIIYYYELDT